MGCSLSTHIYTVYTLSTHCLNTVYTHLHCLNTVYTLSTHIYTHLHCLHTVYTHLHTLTLSTHCLHTSYFVSLFYKIKKIKNYLFKKIWGSFCHIWGNFSMNIFVWIIYLFINLAICLLPVARNLFICYFHLNIMMLTLYWYYFKDYVPN